MTLARLRGIIGDGSDVAAHLSNATGRQMRPGLRPDFLAAQKFHPFEQLGMRGDPDACSQHSA